MNSPQSSAPFTPVPAADIASTTDSAPTTMATQDNEQDDLPATPPAEVPLCDSLLIDSGGSIRDIWPHGKDNELPKLEKNETRDISSVLLDPIDISFSDEPERRRANSNILPRRFYRTCYETSKTQCCFVSKDTHPQHRQAPQLSIEVQNAFQSIGTFNLPTDLTRERIERHLVWNKKIDPSSFISMFDQLSCATKRAGFHYIDSQRIGMRVSIAEISTDGLVAATVKATMRTTVKVTTKHPVLGETVQSAWKIYPITIPVWIHELAGPISGSSITNTTWAMSGADMYLSITEIRKSILKIVTPKIRKWDTIAANGHDYEWLACGRIPKTRIVRIMPWDGKRLHMTQDVRIVRSIDSPDPWVLDWNTSMWRLDPRLYRTACFLSVYGGNKRKTPGSKEEDELPRKRVKRASAKKPKPLKPTKDQHPKPNQNPYDPEAARDMAKPQEEHSVCCSHCGQTKSPFHLEDEIDGPLSYLDLAVSSGHTTRKVR